MNTKPSGADALREFQEWLNSKRGFPVSEVFHDISEKFAAALAVQAQEAAPRDSLHECALGDSNYAAGMLLGWNLCTDGRDEDFHRIREDRLRAAASASKEAHEAAPAARGEPSAWHQGFADHAAPVAAHKPDDEDKGQIEALDLDNHRLRRAMQKVMARLTNLLDEDQFGNIESIVTEAGVEPPEAQNPDDARDAERYRWLRARWGRIADEYDGDSDQLVAIREADSHFEGWDVDPASLDRAIDAAIAKATGRAP